MSDDLLKSAARALREETAQTEASTKFTRARVMASLHQSQVRRRTRLAFLLPIAACFAAASAFGMVSGRGPELIQTVVRALGFQTAAAPVEAPKPAAPKPQRPAPAERVAPEPEPAIAPAPAAPPPTTPPAASIQRDVDPTHHLYLVAHRAHFTDHDYSRALGAWESYLRKAPRGRFAIEAEYNRALCLARLGRGSEARRALEPFAEGQRGGYRQSDARTLYDALSP